MKEVEKLQILLGHWIEHNVSHSEEFERWAGRARDAGLEEVARSVAAARPAWRKRTVASARPWTISTLTQEVNVCQSSIYAIDGEREELLMEDVSQVVVEGDQVRMSSLFGEPLLLRARIREIDLMRHRIILERSEESTN